MLAAACAVSSSARSEVALCATAPTRPPQNTLVSNSFNSRFSAETRHKADIVQRNEGHQSKPTIALHRADLILSCFERTRLPFGHAFAVTTPAHWTTRHGLA